MLLLVSRPTSAYTYGYEDMLHFFRVGLPFFQKWTNVPSDYEEIYQQALLEMQQPDFVCTQSMLTASGARAGGPVLHK